jgi:hypothetical protein
MPVEELEDIADYMISKSMKEVKPRYKKAKALRVKGMFYTSRCFLLYHLLLNVVYWAILVVFPNIAFIDCQLGFYSMSHLAIGAYLIMIFMFDLVYLCQYMDRMSMRFELRAFKNGEYNRKGRFRYMLFAFLESIFEIFMTQLALLDIYTDVCFAILAYNSGLVEIAAASAIFMALFCIPKLVAYVCSILLIFGCTCIKQEDRRRKITFRILSFTEFRMQATNVEYIKYEKNKWDFIMSAFKLGFEDLP